MDTTPQEAEDKQITPSSSPHHSQLYLIIVAVVFLAIGAVIGWYFAKMPTKVPIPQPVTTGTVLSPSPQQIMVDTYTLPTDWLAYDKKFADVHYTFKYPSNYEINDGDPDSGSIYVRPKGSINYPTDLEINSFANSGRQFQPYQTGSRRVWFTENLKSTKLDYLDNAEYSNLIIEDITLPNGKNFLHVSNFPKDEYWQSLYFTIENGISYYVHENGNMNKETIYKVLSTITVSK